MKKTRDTASRAEAPGSAWSRIEKALTEMVEPAQRSLHCLWRPKGVGFTSSCGYGFPHSHDFSYCPYCGQMLASRLSVQLIEKIEEIEKAEGLTAEAAALLSAAKTAALGGGLPTGFPPNEPA